MTLGSLQKKLTTGDATLLYFASQNCSVCKSIQPKLEEALQENYPKIDFIKIQNEKHPKIISAFTVFNAPTILLFLDGKEFIRKGGAFSLPVFLQEVERLYKLFNEKTD